MSPVLPSCFSPLLHSVFRSISHYPCVPWLIWRDPCGEIGLLERIRVWVLPATPLAGWLSSCFPSSVVQQYKNCIFRDATALSHLVEVTCTVQKKKKGGEKLANRQDGGTNCFLRKPDWKVFPLYILSVCIGEPTGSLQSLFPKHILGLAFPPAGAWMKSPEHNAWAGGMQCLPVVGVRITCKVTFYPCIFCAF